MRDLALPAQLTSHLLFGCEDVRHIEGASYYPAYKATRRVVDFSLRWGCSAMPKKVHVRSNAAVQVVYDVLQTVAPPTRATFGLDSRTIYLTDKKTAGTGFVLCFPVAELSSREKELFDELMASANSHFATVRHRRSVLSMERLKICEGCFADSQVSDVLARANLFHHTLCVLRDNLVCEGDDEWTIFRCFMDQVARLTVARAPKKDAFLDWHAAVIDRPPAFSARRGHLRACTGLRVAHLTFRRQRRTADDFFIASGIIDPRVPHPGDRAQSSVLRGSHVLFEHISRGDTVAIPELRNKSAFMGAEVFFQNGPTSLIASLFSSHLPSAAGCSDKAVAARAFMPYVWPISLLEGPVEPAGPIDSDLKQTISDAVHIFVGLLFTIRSDPTHWMANDVDWFTARALVRAGGDVPNAEVLKRSPMHFGIEIVKHFDEKKPAYERAFREHCDTVASFALGVLGEAVNPRANRWRLRRWAGGGLDELATRIVRHGNFAEMNALYRAFRAGDKHVYELGRWEGSAWRPAHMSRILDLEFDPQTRGCLADETPLLIADDARLATRLLEDALAQADEDPYALAGRAVSMDIAKDALEKKKYDTFERMLRARWNLSPDATRAAGPSSSAKSRVKALEKAWKKRRSEPRTMEGLVQDFAHLAHAPDPPPSFVDQRRIWAAGDEETSRFVADVFVEGEVAVGPGSISELLSLVVQEDPFTCLCDGSDARVDHPLWSVRPDMLRAIRRSM